MSLRFTVSWHRVGPKFKRTRDAEVNVGDHLDWFFQFDRGCDSPLRTFSTEACGEPNPDEPDPDEPNHKKREIGIPATRLVDHRARYLDFAGEVSGDRGSVQPLVTGFYDVLLDDPSRFEFRVLAAAVISREVVLPDLNDWVKTPLCLVGKHRVNSFARFEVAFLLNSTL